MKKKSNPSPISSIRKPTPPPAPPKKRDRIVTHEIKFTKPTWQDQPTKDGYYWFKSEFGIEIVMVVNGMALEIGTSACAKVGSIQGQWYGPIKPPKED